MKENSTYTPIETEKVPAFSCGVRTNPPGPTLCQSPYLPPELRDPAESPNFKPYATWSPTCNVGVINCQSVNAVVVRVWSG